MLMYMRAHPMLLWIVPASIAMAVGTTATIMAILQYKSDPGNCRYNYYPPMQYRWNCYRDKWVDHGLLFSNQTKQKNGEDTY